jgi:hypothetical protein
LLEFFGDQALADGLLKLLHAQTEALKDQPFVGIAADEGVADEGIGDQQADAVGALRVGDADPQAIGLIGQGFIENKLVQDLLRVEGPQGLGNRTRLLDASELLLDLENGDGLAAYFGDDVGRGNGSGVLAGHQIEQHAHSDHADKDTQQDAHSQLVSLTQRVPHVTSLSPGELADLAGKPAAAPGSARRAQVKKV